MGLTLWPVALFEVGDLVFSELFPIGLMCSDAMMTSKEAV